MISKSIRNWLYIISILAERSQAGLLSLQKAAHHRDLLGHHSDLSVASSYMHFQGPVEGPEYEVKTSREETRHRYEVQDDSRERQNGQDSDEYAMDYVAQPKYQFSYGVRDHHTGDFHSQKETRDGSSVSGEYSVMEPGGRVRVVSYRADDEGFHAIVRTTGKNEHSTVAHAAYSQDQRYRPTNVDPLVEGQTADVGESDAGQEEQILEEYPASFYEQEQGNY